MQRQKRNELLVAIGVVAVLAFAVAFGAVLSVSNPEDETLETLTPAPPSITTQSTVVADQPTLAGVSGPSTNTPKPSATDVVPSTKVAVRGSDTPTTVAVVTSTRFATETATNTVTSTVTETATDLPTHTTTLIPTFTETSTATMLPSATTEPSATLTDTPLPSTTATDEPSATSEREPSQSDATLTEEPSSTPTDTPSATATETLTLTPTDTATQTSSPTDTPTNTPTDTPSATSTVTPTVTASSTDTATATFTATPSLTPTNTPTPSSTATSTASPTVTPSLTRTPTRTPRPTETNSILPTSTMTPVPSPGPDDCQIPAGWRPYEVRPGNTLFSIARVVGTTITELGRANCLSDLDRIFAGADIFVPEIPEGPVPVVVPPGGRGTLGNCFGTAIQVTSPVPSGSVPSLFAINGTVSWPTLDYYRVEIRPGGQPTYNFWSRSGEAVSGGQLAFIDTSPFASGVHWIRITIVDERGNVPEGTTCEFPVIFN